MWKLRRYYTVWWCLPHAKVVIISRILFWGFFFFLIWPKNSTQLGRWTLNPKQNLIQAGVKLWVLGGQIVRKSAVSTYLYVSQEYYDSQSHSRVHVGAYVGACVGTLADKWITWEWSGYHWCQPWESWLKLFSVEIDSCRSKARPRLWLQIMFMKTPQWFLWLE